MTIAYPYRTIDSDAIKAGLWLLSGEEEGLVPIRGTISGWDYDSRLDFVRHIEFASKEVLSATGLLGNHADLKLNVIALTGPASFRTVVYTTSVPVCECWRHEIAFSMDSENLADSLTLRTELILGMNIEHGRPFVASQKGSRLFSDTEKIQLEGNLGRFPMELVDFSRAMPALRASNAMWYLDWNPSRPESRFLGAVLLYVNAGKREVAERIQAMETVITAVIRCDIIRTMCEGMLLNDEFIAGHTHFDSDTVGGQVRDWLISAFSDMSPEVLRNMLQGSPGRFEARIQETFS